jgi:site-specific recombinase XerD
MPRKLTVVKPRVDPAIATLVDDYLTACRARGLSPKTINEGYGYPLRGIFLPFCAEQHITEPSALTSKVLDRLTSHLLTKGGVRGQLSKHSVDSYARAINNFLNWAAGEGELTATINAKGNTRSSVKAQTPRLPKRLVDVLSKQEIQSLEDAAQTERDKLIVRLLADTGLRLGELVGLRTTDVVRRGREVYLQVRGKGERDRLVPINRLQHRVERFIQHGRPKDSLSDHLFLASRRHGAAGYEALTTRGVHQLIRTLGQKVEIGKRVYPHLLRHSFATSALAGGMNPIQLADILGHRSLVMIMQVYAHLSPSDSYAAMEKLLLARDER